jgi:hypothetical protein
VSNKRCIEVKHYNLQPGWGCCVCKTYNGEQRLVCKVCRHYRCDRESTKDPIDAASLKTHETSTVH